ncbi:T9SS type A sorting domain-containing protein [bacterium]|nr:T9SS type A sorting domain-containing protein [bacterium]
MIRPGQSVLIFILSGFAMVFCREVPALQMKNYSVSHQNLVSEAQLQWDGSRWYRPVGDSRRPRLDPLNVLALMVQFQSDKDAMTTGTGRFMTESPEEPVFNAPPHDRAYFGNQLNALSHYYHTVSQNKVRFECDVFPAVITLSHEMGYYNPGTTEERTDLGLAELFRDAVQAADSAGAPFSDYDVFVIFHAGVGRDIELGYDPTPKDIPSAFLTQSDLVAALGDSLQTGIPVQKGSFFVREVILLPETQNQEGFEFGLLGTMTLMFGFQLGLPALWDTESGRSGVGRWGMMDQGSGNYNGMIPCEPCAFSKVLMGWETPIEVSSDSNLVAACSAAKDSRRIYKVPVNDHEYYLIENRRYDANFDSVTYGRDHTGKQIEFPSTGFFKPEESIGVIVSIDEYDYGLPGSGLLIWHIDESVILENLENNRINADPERKGVDLEEADGAQDIGESYGFLSGGGGSEGGVLHDCWFAGNTVHKQANHSQTVRFGPDTHPNTRSNSGGNTHIVFYDFSESDTLMTFSVTTDLFQAGFPQRFPNHDTTLPPIVGDLDGDGDREIIVVGSYDYIYAWHHDGSLFFETGQEGEYTAISGQTVRYPAPVLPLGLARSRKIDVLGDWDQDGIDELFVAGDKNGETGIHIFHGLDSDSDGIADRKGFIAFNSEDQPSNMALDVSGQRLAVVSYQGYFRLFSSGLELLASSQLKPLTLVGLCQRPGNRGWVVTSQDGSGDVYFLGPQGEVEQHYELMENTDALPSACYIEGFGEFIWFRAQNGCFLWNSETEKIESLDSGEALISGYLPMSIADIDQDGFPEAMHATDSGQIVAFHYRGVIANGFPAPYLERDRTSDPPLIADINGDDQPELIVPDSEGNIEVFTGQGNLLTDFTLSTGNPSLVSVDDVDLDGDLEILAVSSEGMLYVWDMDSPYSGAHVPWGYAAHDPGRTGLCPAAFVPEQPNTSNWMPGNLAYNYPNPNEENFTVIRYRLEKSADVKITIYDLSGEKVEAFSGPGLAQADNEVRWDLSGVASGVYICHIRAEGESGTEETTFKIGVVK